MSCIISQRPAKDKILSFGITAGIIIILSIIISCILTPLILSREIHDDLHSFYDDFYDDFEVCKISRAIKGKFLVTLAVVAEPNSVWVGNIGYSSEYEMYGFEDVTTISSYEEEYTLSSVLDGCNIVVKIHEDKDELPKDVVKTVPFKVNDKILYLCVVDIVPLNAT